jgi:hypothetical protein
MDFGQAALLVFVLLGVIAEVKSLVWGSNKERITIAIVNASAIAVVFLVAETKWGDTQIIGGQNLGLLDWASKLLIAIVLGGGASGLWQGFDTLKNVGQNQLTPIQKQALDEGAQRLVKGTLEADAGGSHPLPDPNTINFPTKP